MIHKSKVSEFAIIDSAVLKDESLSIGARMFYALAQSFDTQWNINIKHFAKLLNVGEASVRKFRNELVNAGLLHYEQGRDEKGKLTQESTYVFKGYEVEEAQEITQEAASYPFKQKTANGKNSDLINIKILNNINSKESETNAQTAKEPNALLLLVKESFKHFKDQKPTRTKPLKELDLDAYTQQEVEAYKRFIRYRKERGFLAKSTIESIVRDFEKLKKQGGDINSCVELCINRGWSGLLKAQEALKRYESYKAPRAFVGERVRNPLERLGL